MSQPPFGQWSWDGTTSCLRVETTGELSDLGGDWSLSAFSVLLEGLSRARLERALAAAGGEVNCPLVLSDGRRVSFFGKFSTARQAAGEIRVEADGGGAGHVPGPDLTPAFQPIISLRTGEVAGFEALARWADDGAEGDHRFEDPALASNMLIKSAEALASWRLATGRDNLFVHVNLTGRDLAVGDQPGLIEALVLGHGLPPGALRIELTEQAALRDIDQAVAAARAIRAAGAGVVLDDFGSGHSSFAWLADIPADSVKIDPDLTRRLDEARVRVILECVTLLASRLDMTVTAEGVEHISDVARLRMLGFRFAQGYAFARPMFAEDALDYLLASGSGRAGTGE